MAENKLLGDLIARKDIGLTALVVAFAAAMLNIFEGTVYPDYGTGWSFTEVLFNIGAIDVTLAFAVVATSATVAYGSDRIYDLAQGDVEISNTDFLAYLGVMVPSTLQTSWSGFSDIFAGEPLLQTVVLFVIGFCMVYIAKTP